MVIIYYILISYFAGVVLTGGYLGWHMAFRLDRFDWHYSKGDVWGAFVLSTLLWPLMLRNLMAPTKLFEGNYGIAASRREEARLWNNPPPCGALILYRPHRHDEEIFGEFTFHSADLEDALVDKLHENPHLAKNDEGAILNWLRQRDDSITVPTVVPQAWWRFEFIADKVLRNGRGEVRCLKCNEPIPMNKLLQKDDHGRRGWNSNRLVCPNGHQLLVVKTIHSHVRSQNGSKGTAEFLLGKSE